MSRQQSRAATRRLARVAARTRGTSLRGAALLALLLFSSACASVDPRTGLAMSQAISPPGRALTPYTEALACLDQLMASQPRGAHRQAISVGLTPDATGRISPGLRDMITATLVRATASSNALIPTEVLTPGTVPPAVTAGSPGAINALLLPSRHANSVQVLGALTQADRNVQAQNAQAGIGLGENRFGLSQNSDISNVGVDLRLTQLDTTRTLLAVSNQVMLKNVSRGVTADFSIRSVGANFELSFDEREGLHQAVRTLVELSLVELLGQYTHVPYWRCLQSDRGRPDVQRQIAAWFRDLDERGLDDYVRRRLRALGYTVPNPPESAASAIGLFQREQRLVPNGRPTFETFAALTDAQLAAAPGPTPKTLPSPEPAGPRRLRLDVTEVELPQPLLQLSVSLDRGGSLACFYRDEEGSIWRILPSQHQPDSGASADAPLRIPPAVGARPVIQPTHMTPQVGFLCATGRRDWAEVLPAAFWGVPLKRLPGANFAALTAALRATGGPEIGLTETSHGRPSGYWSRVPPAPTL